MNIDIFQGKQRKTCTSVCPTSKAPCQLARSFDSFQKHSPKRKQASSILGSTSEQSAEVEAPLDCRSSGGLHAISGRSPRSLPSRVWFSLNLETRSVVEVIAIW